jgi:HlyD family secretion protein
MHEKLTIALGVAASVWQRRTRMLHAHVLWNWTLRARRLIVVLAVAVLLGSGGYWYARSAPAGSTAGLFDVTPGELVVKITEPGEVRASVFVTVLSRKDGPIAYVVPEGTNVKAGDVVVRFDSTQQQAAVTAARTDMLVARAEVRKAEKDVEAQRQKLAAEVAKLEAEAQLAAVELLDLQKKPLRDEVAKARLELDKARVMFEQAEKKRVVLPELVQKGFVTQSTLDEAELNYVASDAGMKAAQFNFDKVAAGATPEELEKATIKLTQTRFALEKARISLKPQLDALEAGIQKHRADVQRAQNLIDKAEDELERTQLRAPQAGLAVYGSRGSGGEKIHAGMMTWAGESLINLPDMSTMVADTEINEIDIGKVRMGAPVEVRLEAYPGAVFHGMVTKIGTVARFKKSRSGAASSVKVFDVTVQITEKDPRIRPGLTATLAVIVEQQKDVLVVPLSAVVARGAEHVVFVANGSRLEERRVTLGASNDRGVVVTDGLRAGERVVLEAPPAGRR